MYTDWIAARRETSGDKPCKRLLRSPQFHRQRILTTQISSDSLKDAQVMGRLRQMELQMALLHLWRDRQWYTPEYPHTCMGKAN
jgi:hypothetical protein